jgi:hypothetical protein
MDVDHDPSQQGTPPDTPFDEGFTPSTTIGQTSADPNRGFHTKNFVTPLYSESQETDHIYVNTTQQPQTLAATREAKMAAAPAAAEA